MPEWLQTIIVAIGSFLGGRVVNSIGDQMKEGRELRRGVDRLTTAVENIGADLREIRGEIHGQVAGLKVEIHDQVSGLRSELHNHVQRQQGQFEAMESRIDATAARIDALSAGSGVFTGPQSLGRGQGRLRLNQELGCYELLGHEPPSEA